MFSFLMQLSQQLMSVYASESVCKEFILVVNKWRKKRATNQECFFVNWYFAVFNKWILFVSNDIDAVKLIFIFSKIRSVHCIARSLEAYSEHCQTSKMGIFSKIVSNWIRLWSFLYWIKFYFSEIFAFQNITLKMIRWILCKSNGEYSQYWQSLTS